MHSPLETAVTSDLLVARKPEAKIWVDAEI